jgi:hypothetical protein
MTPRLAALLAWIQSDVDRFVGLAALVLGVAALLLAVVA